MTVKTFSSKSNANRAAKSLLEKLPNTIVVGPSQPAADGKWFFEIVSQDFEVTLSPEVRELLAPFAVTYPAAPNKSAPLLVRAKMKPVAEWDASSCATPVAVARAVYGEYLLAGRIDERKAAIKAAMALGVQRNTAHTQYRLFRIAQGLSGAVRPVK